MNRDIGNPLVSVGIPTYNRPQLLVRALDSLLKQTYQNLEIVISDNASPDPKVQEIADMYCAKDNRVRYVRNSENIGAIRNFWSVLNLCRGMYFMWAADDDEWESDFIEFCINNIGGAGTVMCDVETVFHLSGNSIPSILPRLSPHKSTYENSIAYLNNMQPSIIYGLHRRDAIRSCVTDNEFDFFDCFIVYRLILRYGIQTCPGIRYRAGVHGVEYVVKFCDDSQKTLKYRTFAIEMIKETISNKNLGVIEKLNLCVLTVRIVLRLYRHFQKK